MAIIVPIVSSWDSSGIDKAIRDIKKAEGAFNSTVAGLKGFGSAFTDIGKQLSFRVTLPLVALGTSAVKTAADFDVSMAQIAVATETPVAGLESLSNLAKQLGADTIFSANEAADAMLELAKAGITPAEIQAGSLKNTLDLAAASGMTLSESAIVMASSMNAFGLDADDTTQIVNALAGAANASAADVADMALALSQASAQANASGMTIQETSAALALFADAGIRGSDAGTSFKTFLMRLNPISKESADIMKQLNISFYDSEGNMKDLVDIAETLQGAFAGMTQEQTQFYIAQLFGSDAARAANLLYQSGAEGLADYMVAVNDTTIATEMAEARQTGMAGAMEQLAGSVDTAKLALGDALEPVVISVAKYLKDLTDRFLALSPETQKMITMALGIAAALGPALILIGQMSIGIAALTSAVKLFGTALMFLTTNPIGLLITGLVLVGLAIYALIKNWDEISAKVKESVGAMIEDAKQLWNGWTEVWGKIKSYFEGIGRDIVDGIKNGISNAWAGFKSWFIGMIGQPIQWAKQILRIASPSKVFEGIGENVVAGYIQGIDNMQGQMKNVMSDVGIESTMAFTTGVGSAPVSTGGSNMVRGGGVYNITVNAGIGTNGQLVGKEIVDAIKRYERASGPVFVSA